MQNRQAPVTVSYLTTDPTNGGLAQDAAAAHGLRLEVLFPQDLPPRTNPAALIVDLDGLHLDAGERRDWLAGLTAAAPSTPTFVHGYDLDEASEVGGVVLARRFDDLLAFLTARLGGNARPAA